MSTKKQRLAEERARLVAAVEAAQAGRDRAEEAFEAARAALEVEWEALRDARTAVEEFDARQAIERMPEDLREAIRVGEITRAEWVALSRRGLAERSTSWRSSHRFVGLGRTVARLLREEGGA